MRKSIFSILAVYALIVAILSGCGAANTTEYNDVNVATVEEDATEIADVVSESVETVDVEAEDSVESNDETDVAEATDVESVDNNVEAETFAFDSLEAICDACNSRAACQDSRLACVVDVENGHNPYDVEWNYGSEWNAYVNACDWSLVFDASYYKKAFPMLAILYNNDDDLLLEHFATVGVHEGRQGSANFNVEAYLNNCSDDVYNRFKNDVEGGYIYYMLHYDTEKNVNTVTCNDGSAVRTQIFVILTAAQTYEVDEINFLRNRNNESEIVAKSELCALANYRAYLNRINHSGYDEGHDWAMNNQSLLLQYLAMTESSGTKLFENTITSHSNMGRTDLVGEYYASQSHKEAMLDSNVTMIGSSNYYHTMSDGTYSQLDIFTY